MPQRGQRNFGFPSTPTDFQKNLMRFASMPAAVKCCQNGWSTEWGRPDIPYELKELSREWTGRPTRVYVRGSPAMGFDATRTVAELQKMVREEMDELFLRVETYAL